MKAVRRRKGERGASWHGLSGTAGLQNLILRDCLSACPPGSNPHGPKSSPEFQSSRIHFNPEPLFGSRPVSLWRSLSVSLSVQPPRCHIAHKLDTLLFSRIQAKKYQLQWTTRMEYDIDLYKHFSWLRKVRDCQHACLVLVYSPCKSQRFFVVPCCYCCCYRLITVAMGDVGGSPVLLGVDIFIY